MELKALIQKISEIDRKLPHCSNLKTKALKEQAGKGRNEALTKEIILLYLKYYQAVCDLDTVNEPKEWIVKALSSFEIYYAEIKSDKFKIFSHQSDFLSSLLPEFLYFLYSKFVLTKYKEFVIETQKDLIIDLSFFPHFSPAIDFKFKRVDVAILQACPLTVNNKIIDGFYIAIIAMEVKTNLDKNMISGVEYSVQRFKRTFPLCKYYLLSEFADFAFEKQNYASSAIDEILITRKQKRSDIRKASTKLNPINDALLYEHLEEVLAHIEKSVQKPTSLSQRLKKGKLIKL